MNGTWLDYYEILEVEFGCSFDEIKDKYRELLRKYHPDNPDGDEEKTILINEAYDVLSDDEKRRKYDETYMSIKNGEMDPNEEEVEDVEMPKYTHEEMYENFNEEEIRFAKKVALQKAISETLENAKIIIDAKNELLFAAFNDCYDSVTYKEEYKEFIRLSKEFIDNLYSLINEAKEYDLDNDINTISEVIEFLNNAINEIPENLKEAKIKVKRELIKEQLKEETQECIDYANMIKNEFINFYIQVYESSIGEEEFNSSYHIYKFNMEDAISRLNQIYELLKMYELDEEFENVGKIIGSLRENILLFKNDYELAKKIGKREYIRLFIQDKIMKFEEYKEKMCDIMQVIAANPSDKKVSDLVFEGRELTHNFQNGFEKISEKDLELDLFKDEIKKIHKRAQKLYSKSKKAHSKMDECFEDKEKKTIGDSEITYLKEDIEGLLDKKEAIKLFRSLFTLIGSFEEYQTFNKKEYKKLLKEFNNLLDRSNSLQRYLDVMYEYVLKMAEEVEQEEQREMPDMFELNKLIEQHKSLAEHYGMLKNAVALAAPVTFIGGFAYSLVTDHKELILPSAIVALVVLVGGAITNIDLSTKEDFHMTKYLYFAHEMTMYTVSSISSSNDVDLNKIYQKALSV